MGLITGGAINALFVSWDLAGITSHFEEDEPRDCALGGWFDVEDSISFSGVSIQLHGISMGSGVSPEA